MGRSSSKKKHRKRRMEITNEQEEGRMESDYEDLEDGGDTPARTDAELAGLRDLCTPPVRNTQREVELKQKLESEGNGSTPPPVTRKNVAANKSTKMGDEEARETARKLEQQMEVEATEEDGMKKKKSGQQYQQEGAARKPPQKQREEAAATGRELKKKNTGQQQGDQADQENVYKPPTWANLFTEQPHKQGGVGMLNWSNLFQEQKQEGVQYYETVEIEGMVMGKIPKQEVEDSSKNWESTVVCKVIGASPPHVIMNGFFRRIWSKLSVQKVWLAKTGIFLVKFAQKVHRDEVVEQGLVMFDNKPVIVQGWSPKLDPTLPKTVPVWIKLPGLDVVYWKPSILSRIVSPLGTPLRMDRATREFGRMSFARILVEVPLGKHIPKTLPYIDEHEVIQHQEIECEWYPANCQHCGMMGHDETVCKKKEFEDRPGEEGKGKPQHHAVAQPARPFRGKPRRVYVPIRTVEPQPKAPETDEEGFTIVTRKRKENAKKEERHQESNKEVEAPVATSSTVLSEVLEDYASSSQGVDMRHVPEPPDGLLLEIWDCKESTI